jgi:hypothetical protein
MGVSNDMGEWDRLGREEIQDGSLDIITVGGITQHTEAMQSLANTKRSTS